MCAGHSIRGETPFYPRSIVTRHHRLYTKATDTDYRSSNHNHTLHTTLQGIPLNKGPNALLSRSGSMSACVLCVTHRELTSLPAHVPASSQSLPVHVHLTRLHGSNHGVVRVPISTSRDFTRDHIMGTLYRHQPCCTDIRNQWPPVIRPDSRSYPMVGCHFCRMDCALSRMYAE